MFTARKIFFGGIFFVMITASLHAQSSDSLLAVAERRVNEIDSANHFFSGSFVQHVESHSLFGPDTLNAVDSFLIRVKQGYQDSRTPLDTTASPEGVRLPPNCGSVFALRNALFPFRAAAMGTAVDVETERYADTTFNNRRCAVIAFTFHAHTDSLFTRGGGRLWIALDDGTPVISEYDFQGNHPRRGIFISNVAIQTNTINARTVIVRNATHIRFSLMGHEVGDQQATVVNDSFSSE